jgi:hypothetical protein
VELVKHSVDLKELLILGSSTEIPSESIQSRRDVVAPVPQREVERGIRETAEHEQIVRAVKGGSCETIATIRTRAFTSTGIGQSLALWN